MRSIFHFLRSSFFRAFVHFCDISRYYLCSWIWRRCIFWCIMIFELSENLEHYRSKIRVFRILIPCYLCAWLKQIYHLIQFRIQMRLNLFHFRIYWFFDARFNDCLCFLLISLFTLVFHFDICASSLIENRIHIRICVCIRIWIYRTIDFELI